MGNKIEQYKTDSIEENESIIIHKMEKPDDIISLHKTLENIFG
jgi:hypothetical protein